MSQYTHITHPFKPIYNDSSEILILGTLPSVKSREDNFYYAHKQNRFWKVLQNLYSEEITDSVDSKIEFLLRHNIAIWDVIYSCDIVGSSDSSIKNVVPTDLVDIIKKSNIKRVYANGKKAAELYNRYQYETTQLSITALPSTSPANAAWNFERLADAWKTIKQEEQ